MTVVHVVTAEDKHVAIADRQDVGIAAPLCHFLDGLHLALPVVALDGVGCIVVAADDDAPVG